MSYEENAQSRKKLIAEREKLRQRLSEIENSLGNTLSEEQDNFFETLLDTIPNPVFFKDVTGLYRGCNKAFEEYTGIPRSEIIGKTVYDISPPDIAEKYAAADAELFAHPGKQRYNWKVKTADGEVRDVIFNKATYRNSHNSVAGIIGVVVDISEMKRNEKAILDIAKFPSENPAPVLRVDNDGNLLYANEASRPLLDDWNCKRGAAVPEDIRKVARYTILKSEVSSIDVRLGQMYFMASFVPITESGYVNIYFADVTAHKQIEKKLKNTMVELRRLNRALRMISECNQALVRAQKESELFEDICQILLNRGEFSFTWIGIIENKGEKRIIPVAKAGKTTEFLNSLDFSWDNLDNLPCGKSVKNGEQVIIQNILSEKTFQEWKDKALEYNCVSMISLPLATEKETVGSLNIYSKVPGLFHAEEVDLLRQLADDIGYGIDTLRTRAARLRDLESIARSEKDYRTLFETMTQGVVYQDKEGRILSANPAAERILGVSLEQMKGRTSVDPRWKAVRENGSDFPGQEHPAMIALRTGKQVLNHMMGIFNPEMEDIRWILVDAIPQFRENEKEPYRVYTLFEDITESRMIREKQKGLEEQLAQTRKMESIGLLAGGIAHDFNNILSIILGYSDLAKNADPAPDETIRDSLDEIEKAGVRASELVRQILSFSRKTKTERKPFRLGIIIRETLKMIRASLPTTIEIHYSANTSNDFILAGPSQIEQILLNLCMNAAHAMREKGGKMKLVLDDAFIDDSTYTLSGDIAPGEYVKLSISDTGCGIPAEHLNRIFDPYFTTKKKGEGTGLGLSVVYGLVKRLEGIIKVTSEEGIGTQFDIFLPKYHHVEQENHDNQPVLERGSERILIVDDESGIVNFETMLLKNLGYKVTGFTDSNDALEYFTKNPEDVDIVITDQTMPHMTGAELSEKMLAIRSDINIILCTGYSSQVDHEIARKIGIKKMLYKPVTSDVLAKTIRNICKNGR